MYRLNNTIVVHYIFEIDLFVIKSFCIEQQPTVERRA